MKIVHLLTRRVSERVMHQVLSLCKEQKELGMCTKLWIIASDEDFIIPANEIDVSFFKVRSMIPFISRQVKAAIENSPTATSFHLHSPPGFMEKELCSHIYNRGFKLSLNFLEVSLRSSFYTKLFYEMFGHTMTHRATTVSAESPWIKSRIKEAVHDGKIISVPLAHNKNADNMNFIMKSSHQTTFAYYGLFDKNMDHIQKMLSGFKKYLAKFKGSGNLMFVGSASAFAIRFLKKTTLDYGLQNRISFHFNLKDELGLLHQSDYIINSGTSGQELTYIQKAIQLQKPCLIPSDHPAIHMYELESLFMQIRKRKTNFFASSFIQAERMFGKEGYSDFQQGIQSVVDLYWSKSSRLKFFRHLYAASSSS